MVTHDDMWITGFSAVLVTAKRAIRAVQSGSFNLQIGCHCFCIGLFVPNPLIMNENNAPKYYSNVTSGEIFTKQMSHWLITE